jgi:hypothetical protein
MMMNELRTKKNGDIIVVVYDNKALAVVYKVVGMVLYLFGLNFSI